MDPDAVAVVVFDKAELAKAICSGLQSKMTGTAMDAISGPN